MINQLFIGDRKQGAIKNRSYRRCYTWMMSSFLLLNSSCMHWCDDTTYWCSLVAVWFSNISWSTTNCWPFITQPLLAIAGLLHFHLFTDAISVHLTHVTIVDLYAKYSIQNAITWVYSYFRWHCYRSEE